MIEVKDDMKWSESLMIQFEKARLEDVEELRNIQVKTFDDDARKFNGMDKGGPPGYDSIHIMISCGG